MLILWCTGLGAVEPSVAAGELARPSPLSHTVTTPSVSIGGIAARVLSSVLSPGYAGLEQVAAVVPAGVAPGKAQAAVSIGGRKSNAVIVPVR